MDIESFFNCIDHAVLINLVKRWVERLTPTVSEGEGAILFATAQTIIMHNPTKNVIYTGDKEKLKIIPRSKSYFHNAPGKGLPLGNLSSQFFANIYLHELDWFVKHRVNTMSNGSSHQPSTINHQTYYLRYVDDVVLLAETPEQLKVWHKSISDFLENKLSLRLHPQKTILQPARYGIDFLGYIVRKDYLLVRRRVVKNFKRKLYSFNQHPLPAASKQIASVLSSINSYYGIFRFADTHHLRKDLYLNRFGNLQKMFYANGWFQKIGMLALSEPK